MGDFGDIILTLITTIIAFLLFGILFLLIRKLVRVLVKTRSTKQNILFYFPVIEFIIFALILVRSTTSLVTHNTTIGVILIVIIVLSLWLFIKNYIIGAIFRLFNRNITGSMVVVNGVEGRVSAYLITSIALKNAKDEIVKIPYSEFYRQYSTSTFKNEKIVKLEIEISLRKTKTNSVEQTVKNYLMASPWVVISEPVEVVYMPDSNILKCYFYSLSEQHKPAIRKGVLSLF